MTIQELQNNFLGTKKVSALDFFVLLRAVTKKERAYLFAHPEYVLRKNEEKKILSFFSRTINNEPIAYILNQKEFYGNLFTVTKDTLIPRPETELLVETAFDEIRMLQKDKKNIHIFDIGTGSGNIIISLAKKITTKQEINTPLIKFFASDIFPKVIAVARKNAKYNNVHHCIHFQKGTLTTPFKKQLLSKDNDILITANLPYLSSKIYNHTLPNVKNFEPKTALFSKKNGLDHYYKLFQEIKDIEKKITLCIEISPEQTNILQKNIPRFFPNATIKIFKDLAKKNRVVVIRKNA